MHELCYAVSDSPAEGFVCGGVIVSNNDMHIDSYKTAGKPAAYGANNHGSIVDIQGQWYIFYHRQTNGHCSAARAALSLSASFTDGRSPSYGASGGPLRGDGEYPAYIANNLFTQENHPIVAVPTGLPRITHDGRDGDETESYVAKIQDDTTIGFKIPFSSLKAASPEMELAAAYLRCLFIGFMSLKMKRIISANISALSQLNQKSR